MGLVNACFPTAKVYPLERELRAKSSIYTWSQVSTGGVLNPFKQRCVNVVV